MYPGLQEPLYSRFIEQVNITINLLRASHVNPKVSAWAYLSKHFDFNRTPLAPVGTKCIIYDDPKSRGTWDVHGRDVFYLGLALEHYCGYRVYVKDTQEFAM
eukprot:14966646-Ditylum_brightwellii.AAC.1